MDVQAELHGVLPVQQKAFVGLQRSGVNWSNRLIQAAAVCNGLTWVNRTAVVGEEAELSLYRLAEARFLVSRVLSRINNLSALPKTGLMHAAHLSVGANTAPQDRCAWQGSTAQKHAAWPAM